jgi:hypothetical protein
VGIRLEFTGLVPEVFGDLSCLVFRRKGRLLGTEAEQRAEYPLGPQGGCSSETAQKLAMNDYVGFVMD